MFNRTVTILLVLSLTGCGTIVTPVPLAVLNHNRQILSATTAPILSTGLPPTTPSYLIRIDANGVQVGRWLWRTFTTSAAAYPPVQLWLDVAESGTINGVLSIYPNSSDIPQSALTLIQQNGCNVSFKSLDDSAIQGAFVSTTEAYVQIDIATCAVKYYGESPLPNPYAVIFSSNMTMP